MAGPWEKFAAAHSNDAETFSDDPQSARAAEGLLALLRTAPVQQALDVGGNLDRYGKTVKDAMGGDPDAKLELAEHSLGTAMGTLKSAPKKAKAAAELPMDEASRMARAKEMGFDTEKTLYHGTKADIEAFDPKMLGASTDTRSAKQAHFLTDNPEIAELFGYIAPVPERAALEQANKQIYEEYTKALNASFNKKISAAERRRINKLGSKLDEVQEAADAIPSGKRSMDRVNVIPAHVKTQNPMIVDMKGKEFGDTGKTLAEHLSEAREAGHDSVIFKNAIDTPHQAQRTPSTITAVFEPSQIRSKFAAFDPKKKKSGNISAAIGAAALGAGAMAAGGSEAQASELKGEAKWASSGAAKLGLSESQAAKLMGSKEGKRLLIEASDLSKDSQAIKQIQKKITKGWGN